MSDDPKIFRPEDMAALVADAVLRLIDCAEPDQDTLRGVAELAEALEYGLTRGLAYEGVQYWTWVAAVESALAFSSRTPTERARHRRLAFRALRTARSFDSDVQLLPVSGWADADIDEFWKVGLAAQALSITRLRAARTPSAEVAVELMRIASIAAEFDAVRLAAATRSVARDLELDLPEVAERQARADAVRGMHPSEFASRMIAGGRPDLCEPALKRAGLAELAETAGASGQAAARAADLLEAIATADAWPYLFGGPPLGWGSVRGDLLFDSLFYRAAAIGAGRRTGHLPWRGAADLVGETDTLWLRELDPDLSALVGVSYTVRAGWRSALIRPRPEAREALHRLTTGQVRDLTTQDFQHLGALLLEPLLDGATEPRLLRAVLSPRLRCMPLEALGIDGKALVDDTLVSVVPGLLCLTGRTRRERADGASQEDRWRVLGLFDPRLPGARTEIDVLRDLVRRELAEGIGFNGPVGIKKSLHDEDWDVLTVAVHGTIRSGVPVLELPAGLLALPDLLECPLPPVVNLGACRTAEPSGPAVPLEWVTVALRRGARSIVAARWSVPDRSSSRITTRFYTNLAERRYEHAAPAFWEAVQKERRRRPHPWFWAGLGIFGDELR